MDKKLYRAITVAHKLYSDDFIKTSTQLYQMVRGIKSDDPDRVKRIVKWVHLLAKRAYNVFNKPKKKNR